MAEEPDKRIVVELLASMAAEVAEKALNASASALPKRLSDYTQASRLRKAGQDMWALGRVMEILSQAGSRR